MNSTNENRKKSSSNELNRKGYIFFSGENPVEAFSKTGETNTFGIAYFKKKYREEPFNLLK